MRKLDPQPLDTSNWRRWRTACQRATQTCEASVARDNKTKFSEGTYKWRSIKRAYFFSKGPPFYGKCAYCENDLPDLRGDVEHFRPKGGVTDEHDNVVYRKDHHGDPVPDEDGNPMPHLGYYWLAYDWRNLLPSCAGCNQPTTIGDKKIGKHNRFPVVGAHAQTPKEVAGEQPLLIHPATGEAEDDPWKHLTVNPDGFIVPLTDRGEMCKEIFGLNLRDHLLQGRRRAINEVYGLLLKINKEPAQRDTARARLIEILEGKHSFTTASLVTFAKLQPDFAREVGLSVPRLPG